MDAWSVWMFLTIPAVWVHAGAPMQFKRVATNWVSPTGFND